MGVENLDWEIIEWEGRQTKGLSLIDKFQMGWITFSAEMQGGLSERNETIHHRVKTVSVGCPIGAGPVARAVSA